VTQTERVVAFASVLMMLVGLAGWFCWFLPMPAYIEVPNSEPHGIAINSNGHIYCGVSGYCGRVQEYTADGKFVRAYRTRGGTGRGTSFDFYVDANDCLCTRVFGYLRGHRESYCRLSVYDRAGNLVRSETSTSTNTNFYYPAVNSVRDAAGNEYTLRGFMFPEVVRRTPAGARTTVVGINTLVWPFQAPLPAFALIAIPIMVRFRKVHKSGKLFRVEQAGAGIEREPTVQDVLTVWLKAIVTMAKAVIAMIVALVATACVAAIVSPDRDKLIIGYVIVPAVAVYFGFEAVRGTNKARHVLYWLAVCGCIFGYAIHQNPGVSLSQILRYSLGDAIILLTGAALVYVWLVKWPFFVRGHSRFWWPDQH
jgi:hypothetical protein